MVHLKAKHCSQLRSNPRYLTVGQMCQETPTMVNICQQNVLVMKLSGIKQLKFSGTQKKALAKLYKLRSFPDIVEWIVTDIPLGILFIAHTYFSKNLISSHSMYSVNVCYAFEHHTCYPLCLLVQQKRTVAALALRANCLPFLLHD